MIKKGGMAAGSNMNAFLIIYVHILSKFNSSPFIGWQKLPRFWALMTGNGLILKTRWRLSTGTKECPAPQHQGKTPMLRIRDILVRIRIRGSVPLMNGTGSDAGSGSWYFRHSGLNEPSLDPNSNSRTIPLSLESNKELWSWIYVVLFFVMPKKCRVELYFQSHWYFYITCICVKLNQN
jgi:hypothetical protein